MSTTERIGRTVRLYRLTMIDEPDGVMVGRPATGSYALFPAEGAQTLRMLAGGASVAETSAWYERTYGSPLDFEDFLEVLADLGFLLPQGESEPEETPVRWQRLGRALFSVPAWVCYLALAVAAVVEIVRVPALRPSYRDLFFTGQISLIPIVLTAAQIPCLLLHESFHTLAGRRLGLPSTLGIGRRLFYLVAETRMDSLLSVPRRRRYLPFLAGMVLDSVLVAGLTLLAAALRGRGLPAWVPGVCLAVSFSTLLRLLWQFMLHLQTDLYYVAATALRCADLQNATRFFVRAQMRRLLRRAPQPPDEEWTDRDRQVARYYAPLLISGYVFSIGSLVWAGIPATVRFWSTVFNRLRGPHTPPAQLVDTGIFVALAATQFGLLAYVTLRDRRARVRSQNSRGGLA